MNGVILSGRLTKDPEIRYTAGENPKAVARYTLAVNKRTSKESSENNADFIPCVVWGKRALIAEKYLKKGMKIVIHGHLSTGSYTNKEGLRIFTMEVVIDQQEFNVFSNNASDQQKPDNAGKKHFECERQYTAKEWEAMERDLSAANYTVDEEEIATDNPFLAQAAETTGKPETEKTESAEAGGSGASNNMPVWNDMSFGIPEEELPFC